MSRMMVLVAVLSVVLVAGYAMAQQGMQGSPGDTSYQRSQQQASPGLGASAGMGQQHIQQLSQRVKQNDADLQKAIDVAKRQARDGQVIGAAFVLHRGGAGGSAGQPGRDTDSATGESDAASPGLGTGGSQGQDVIAHVYVFADNQIKDMQVDAKASRVLDTRNRQMVMNPWLLGQAGMRGMGSSAGADQPGTTGRTESRSDREGLPIGGGQQMLTMSQAQQISRLAEQQNASLEDAINKAKSQVQDGQVIGAFLVLQQQGQQTTGQQPTGQQGNLICKVYVVDNNNQLKVVHLDAKGDQIQTIETQQTLMTSPWHAARTDTGLGGSSPQRSQDRPDTGERFPTGSGSGTGPGSLGGEK